MDTTETTETKTGTLIPLNRLLRWDDNPRVGRDEALIAQMKASIKEKGLLQNLLVVPAKDKDGCHVVIGGETRRSALEALAGEGFIAADHGIRCFVAGVDIDDPSALEAALAENVIRGVMDEIDQCAAMAKLVHMGRSVEHIAVVFGYNTRLVKERLALGRLVDAAQDLVRAGKRDLDWARAMTLVDAAMQNKICADIANHPAAWKDGGDVRRFLTAETIPAENAIFDLDAYKGPIVRDMFDGDKLVDRAAFWNLQNTAVDGLKSTLSGEGFAGVEISHQPIDLWRFRKTETETAGKALIEVSPNGRVTVHRGYVEAEPAANDAAIEEIPAEAEDAELHGDAVRLTPGVLEYAAAHRAALVQTAVASDRRAALEIVVAGLIGHGEIAIRAQDYKFPGTVEIRVGDAFDAAKANRDEIDRALADNGVPATGREDADVLSLVQKLDDAQLDALFARLVAAKIGGPAKKLDAKPTSLVNSFGRRACPDIRARWTPDEKFFGLMTAADLRRIAQDLLPGDRQQGVLTAKKPHLVKMLSDAFADARDGDGSMDAAHVQRLNAWVPGVMRFPAEDDATASAAALFAEGGPAEGDAPMNALFADEAKAA